MAQREPHAARLPGGYAESPTEIPARGWWQVTKRAWRESRADNVPMLAAGVAFFAFLALVPTLIAALTLYGLVADPGQVTEQLRGLSGALPPGARELITDQLAAVASSGGRALTVGLVVSLLAALWSASSGTGHLMTAVNLAYDEEEGRGFLKQKAIALVLTLGAIVFVLVALVLVAVLPVAFDVLGLGGVGRVVAQVLRWLLIVVVVLVGLAVVYRVAPDRDAPRFRWASVGALVATVLWLLGNIGFSVYVTFFGHYNKTYGALAGVVVLLLWLYLSCYVVLLGAEINAEAEKQTVRDSTTGPAEPLGRRGAQAADTVAESD
jgi:membrane protein